MRREVPPPTDGIRAPEAIARVHLRVRPIRRERVLPSVDQRNAQEPQEADLPRAVAVKDALEPPIEPSRSGAYAKAQ
jgi:hypothetical protein